MLGVQNGATVLPDCAPLSLMQDLTHWDWLCHKWGMAPSAICECGVEDQTADPIMQRCQYSPPNGVHGLQVLDDDIIKWLLTSCPNI